MTDPTARRRALQATRATALEAQLLRFLGPFTGDERALDAGCGTGALAYALAPHVGEVIGVDPSSTFVAAAADDAPPNCAFEVGDAIGLPFGYGAFDLACCLRVLHHVRRPELVVAELTRVTRSGGRVLVVDQLGDIDPSRARDLDRFEHERDPSHTRLLPDGDIRNLLDANDLRLVASEIVHEQRDVEQFLELAGLEGGERERLRRMAPAPVYEIEIGWYVARKR